MLFRSVITPHRAQDHAAGSKIHGDPGNHRDRLIDERERFRMLTLQMMDLPEEMKRVAQPRCRCQDGAVMIARLNQLAGILRLDAGAKPRFDPVGARCNIAT